MDFVEEHIRHIKKQISDQPPNIKTLVVFFHDKSDAVKVANFFRNEGYRCTITETGQWIIPFELQITFK